MPTFQSGQRVRVREAHNLRGVVVRLSEDDNLADVRFDHHDSLYPYHVEDLDHESIPCGCRFCIVRPGSIRAP
jgi:hypothetical protein